MCALRAFSCLFGGLVRFPGSRRRAQGNSPLHRHGVFRDGAGLVYAQHIHPGQRLNRFHIVHQHFVHGKPHHAHRHGHAGQQIQALRDHADHGRHGSRHAAPEAFAVDEKLLGKQQDADGNNQDTHDLYQAVQRADHLRLLSPLLGLCLQRQLGNVGVCPHLIQSGLALSGDNKASRKQVVPRFFGYFIRLTGDQGFVHGDFSFLHHRIRRYLVAGFKNYQVVQHQFLRRYHLLFSLPKRPDLRSA